MQGLAGKTAIVTGGAAGIGYAIAERLAAEGVRVCVADLADGTATAAAALPGEALAFTGDLSDQQIVGRLVETTRAAFGRIDILVNNAGGGVIRPFLEHTAETLKQTVDRNLWTVLWCCHAILPLMLEQGGGRIVNIGADSVRNGLPEHAAYNAAKGGMHGLTTGLAREFAQRNITVNTVAPCMVSTPMVAELMAKRDPWVMQFNDVIPMGRPGTMEEVASMVAYLASDEASFVTGQVISVNGGSTML
ncbi:MAG: SDR family NAD(P)-dependent oxidoreductase [Gammaproteobacteria bacterium]